MEPVLLGVCDGDLDPGRYRSSYQTNKVGGLADWLPAVTGRTPRCALCGAPSALVVQVYCPLDASPRHRNLHVFACPAPGCTGRSESWTVLRSQSPDTPGHRGSPQPAQQRPLPDTHWCDGAEDWGGEGGEEWGMDGGEERRMDGGEERGPNGGEERGMDGGEERGLNGGEERRMEGGEERRMEGGEERRMEDEERGPEEGSVAVDVGGHLQRLSLKESQQPVFHPLFISVLEEEELSGDDAHLEHARQLLREYERREGAVALGEELQGGGASTEKYEKTSARHGDAVFCRFLKKTSPCPQQILRYQRGGSPLLVSQPPPNIAGAACGACGGSRTFELQLMPALVSLLRRADGSPEAELEFGTVLVFTCSQSCWPPGRHAALEELCCLQSDPDQPLFTQSPKPAP